jgi:hypothetical protein
MYRILYRAERWRRHKSCYFDLQWHQFYLFHEDYGDIRVQTLLKGQVSVVMTRGRTDTLHETMSQVAPDKPLHIGGYFL